MSTQVFNTIIIGGGAIGLSTAYHLGAAGDSDCLLLERHALSSGTSWHAAGIIGPLRASKSATQLAAYAPEFFSHLEQTTGVSTGYQKTGGLWLSQTPARDIELQRIAALGTSMGFHIDLMNSQQLALQQSWLNNNHITSAMWVEEDGQANAVDVCQALAKGAQAFGVSIAQNCLISNVQRLENGQGYRLTVANGEHYECAKLVVCAGMWSNNLLSQLGLHLPLQGVEHMYLVTEAIAGLPSPVPITRDLDAGIYCKGEAGKLVLGGFEKHAKLVSDKLPALQEAYALFGEDWEQFEPFIEAGIKRFPQLATSGIQTFINGPESFTYDTQPILGPVPGKKGLYVACGMNSLGIVSAPGVGKSMAEWILDGQPQWDLLAQDVARVNLPHSTPGYIAERMQEAVANQFSMHWPYKQPVYGRACKRTPVHHLLQQQGAQFGQLGGWERPLWFDKQQADYSFTQQHWWPQVQKEGKALAETCGLMDLSPFCKLRIQGPNAIDLMQRVCSRDMDCAHMRSRYCLILNHQGGIVADVTVTRLACNDYLMVAAATLQPRLWHWLESHLRDAEQVQLQDTSQLESVFAVAGPNSQALLQQLCDTQAQAELIAQQGFAHVCHSSLAMVPVRLARVSFVGEFGYEIYCPVEFSCHLYEQLCAAGESHGLQAIGMHTIDACRMEKGFVHWGHDISPTDNPISAELMFAVDMNKPANFVGQEALSAMLLAPEQGACQQRRVILQLEQVSLSASPDAENAMPLLYHDEPVYLAGKVIGHTTSGAVGPRTQAGLCMAYIDASVANLALEQPTQVDINIAGRSYPARILTNAAYDPQHLRLRGTCP